MQRTAIHTLLGVGLCAGVAPPVGAETAPASPSVFTFNKGETVERLVLTSGQRPEGGCFSPDQLAPRPVANREAAGIGAAWDVGDAGLLGLRAGPTGELRYGIPLYNGTVGTLPEDGPDDLALPSGGSLTVIDAGSGQPLRGADVLLRAGDGGLCRTRTNEQGVAALPGAVSSVGVVVAADGFAGGLVPLPADRRLRLRRARSIAVHLSSPTGAAPADLAVVAFPERTRGSTGGPLGVAATEGVGVVQLPGLPASRGRVLVVAFRDGVPVGMSPLDALVDDGVSLHVGSGAVTAELPARDGSSPIDTVRIERLDEGTELADFSFGPFARRLDFRLHPTGPVLSRDDLLAYAWYSVVGAEDGLSFYLDGGERKNLGDLAAPNLLTLVVSGPVSTQGWARYSCRDDSRDFEWQPGRSLIGGTGRFPLWLPRKCTRVLGRVLVDGLLNHRFRWSDGDPRELEIAMRRGLAIRGSVSLRGEGPAAGATVTLRHGRSIGDWPGYSLGTSGPAGDFEIRVPVEGDYVVEATLDGYYAPNVAVTTGQSTVEIEMYEAARLRGVVRNARREPVEGIVTWRRAGSENAESVSTVGRFTSTNAEGAFSFAALPPGRTEVAVTVAGQREPFEYELDPGDNEVEIRLESPLIRIEGVVVGPPDAVADVEWIVADPEPAYTRPRSWLRAELARDGTFFFENMSPGAVKLAATTESHASRPVEVVLAPTDTVRQVTLELFEASGRIAGRIESPASPAGARIHASAGLYFESVEISASGEFELSDLAVGSWSLSLYHAARSQGQFLYPDMATVQIPREGSFRYVDVDLTALPALTLSGGPPGATVYGAGNVKLDEDGNGVLRVPKAGAYELYWEVGDHYHYRDVNVEGNRRLNLAEPPDRKAPVPLVDY